MILIKKALRSMWGNKKAYIACIVLIMIGVFISNITGIASGVFSVARDRYYQDYRLADIFAKVSSMPSSAMADIERMEGIKESAGRYTYDARVLWDSDMLTTLRITSVDRSYDGMPVNGVLVTGNGFGSSFDIMLGKAFLDTHGLKIGDSIQVIVEKKVFTLNICAIADSPEYVYPIKDVMEMLPDPESFSYAFMPLDGLWALTGRQGFYNDICLELADGYIYDDVKTLLEDELLKYGLISMYPRKDQISVSMVDMELDSIATMSNVMPMVFMMMSVVVLYLMLKRIIEQERTQIGVMKAFGYSDSVILFHYVIYGVVTGVIGGAMGCVYGVAASGPYITIFREFFNLPIEGVGIPVMLLVKSFMIAVVAGVLGGFFGAYRSLKLDPAEAMRPEAPKIVKSDMLSKLPFLYAMLDSGGSMAIRSIMRNKARSAVIVMGVVFSFGLMGFMGSYNVMIDFMLINQFSKVQRYDAKLVFNAPVEYCAATEAAYDIDGVSLAEGILELPVELKNRNLKAGVSLVGVEQGSVLYAIYDNEKDYIYKPPADGIIINDGLAKKLNVKKGEGIYLSSTLLDEDIKLMVVEIVQQNLGLACFMDINAMSEMFHLNKTATSVIVKTNSSNNLRGLIDDAKNIVLIEDKAATLEKYAGFLAPYSSMIYIMWLMAVVVAFAIIYNTSTISLSERKREYATLRVIGMQVKEVSAIMAFEYWTLCFIGILLGVPFTMLLKEALAFAFVTDAFTFPTFTPMSAYAQAVAGCIAAVLLANRSAAKQIGKFDMVEVLKERE